MTNNSDTTKEYLDALSYAFNEYKQANEQRLSSMEQKQVDPLIEHKMSRMEDFMDKKEEEIRKIKAQINRPAIFDADDNQNFLVTNAPNSGNKYVKGLANYVKGNSSNIKTKSIDVAPVDATEDYRVPTQIQGILDRNQIPILGLVNQVVCNSHLLKMPVFSKGPAIQMLKRGAERQAVDDPIIDNIEIGLFPFTTQLRINSGFLSDVSQTNIEEMIQKRIFNQTQDFINNVIINGIEGGIEGIFDKNINFDAQTDDDIQGFLSGADGAFAEENAGDVIIDMVTSLDGMYSDPIFIMSKSANRLVRQIKDTQGRYVYEYLQNNDGSFSQQLMGCKLYVSKHIEEVAKDSPSILFGDFKAGYTAALHSDGLVVKKDENSAFPTVLINTLMTVGGCVCDPKAIKVMYFSAEKPKLKEKKKQKSYDSSKFSKQNSFFKNY